MVFFGVEMSSLSVFVFNPAAKVRRRWKETGGPEAQRKRPEQQHQLHSGSLLRNRRILDPSVFKGRSVAAKHCASSLTPFSHLLLRFISTYLFKKKKGNTKDYILNQNTHRMHFNVSCLSLFVMVWLMESGVV